MTLVKRLSLRFVSSLGSVAIDLCDSIGLFLLFIVETVRAALSRAPNLYRLLAQVNAVGVSSFSIIFLTGLFTGMVFAVQSYVGFQRVGGEQYIGSVVALGLIRELGPVLTGLMVTGRAGSAITAELGSMRVTEQIDALVTLRINPLHYLVVPRIMAGVITLPCLALFSMAIGIVGGYTVCVHVLGLSPEDYVTSVRSFVELRDICGGIFKAGVFGLILTTIASYKGMQAHGGARGVGIATTQSVVLSSVTILVVDYLLTQIMERL